MSLGSRLTESIWSKTTLVVGAGVAGLLTAALSYAQVPAPGARTVRGTVDRFTTAPRGEVDGAVLDDGTIIHWPPHAGDRVASALKKGDRVEVTGQTETGPTGDSHFEVQTLKNVTSDATVDIAAIAPPPPGQGPRARDVRAGAGRDMVRGRIERFTTAPRGEVDGAVLDDGTLIHWPPHVGDRIAKMLSKGDRIEANGQQETGPAGDDHFEIQNITNVSNNGSFTVDDPRPRPPRRGLRERAARSEGPAKTVRGTVERFTTAPRGEVDGAVLNDGTTIHWPPHLQDRYKGQVRVGQQVDVTGLMETGPEGDTHLEVQTLTSLTEAGSAAGPAAASREERLQDLQNQLDRIQREIDRLRREQ